MASNIKVKSFISKFSHFPFKSSPLGLNVLVKIAVQNYAKCLLTKQGADFVVTLRNHVETYL
jgi:hypothetical protein